MQIVVGIPMVSSAGNLDFWLRLCGVRHLPECSDLLAGFPRQGDLGKEAFNAAVKQWNADLIQRVGCWHGGRVASLPCVTSGAGAVSGRGKPLPLHGSDSFTRAFATSAKGLVLRLASW